MNALTRAAAGSEMAELSGHQRRLLMARLIWPAYQARKRAGLAGDDFVGWRREEQWKACGKEYLRASTQADFPKLMGYFLRMLGRRDAARGWDARGAMGNLGAVRRRLEREMEAARDAIARPEEYVAAISRSRFKTGDVGSLSARQLWTLVFDLRRAAGRRRTDTRGQMTEGRGQRAEDRGR